jgi:hypothetical protein
VCDLEELTDCREASILEFSDVCGVDPHALEQVDGLEGHDFHVLHLLQLFFGFHVRLTLASVYVYLLGGSWKSTSDKRETYALDIKEEGEEEEEQGALEGKLESEAKRAASPAVSDVRRSRAF